MDYKEKYEQALERARQFSEKPYLEDSAGIVEYIFPELKESEDERIRKELIEYIKDQQSSFISAPDCRDKYEEEENNKYNSWLAWLEKQGEQKPNFCHHEVDLSGCSDEYCKAYYDGWNNCNQQHAQLEAEQNPMSLESVAKVFLEELSKTPYNNKPVTDAQVITRELLKFLNDSNSYNPNALNEQKPDDKVEPKFKVGDVVTNKKSRDIVKIVQILHDSYCYTGWDGAATVHSDFSISEQDDWELVHQTPAWSEEDEKQARQIERIVHDDGCTQKLQKQIADWFESLKDRVLPQLKQEWSEKDVEMFGNVLSTLSICSNNPDIPIDVRKMHQKEYAWFNELYNRVQPQQEWSEEDEEAINLACSILYSNFNENENFDKNQMCIGEIIEKLESLRPQSHWRPSDEQMEVLQWCMPLWAEPKSKAILESLINDLKKLKS